MPTCVIFNPTARGNKARTFRAFLDTLAPYCTLRPTTAPGEARTLAAAAVREGFDTIIAAGGDGTVNEVLNGLGDAPGGFTRARLGVLPLGTVNVLASELGLPLKLPAAWQVILRGNETTIDLPKAKFMAAGKIEHRYFVQLAGAGLDSRAIELVNWEWKKKLGPLAYVAAGLKAMCGPHPRVTVENQNNVSGELVLLGNGRLYGGDFVFFPKASLTDGLIHVCVFPRVTWLGLFQTGLGLLTGRLHQFSSTVQLQLPSVKLTATDRVLLELDGDNVGELPATFSIIPKTLRVIVP